MGTRTINLSDAAYARLHALKKEGESFSDVVNRVTGKYALLDLVGILDDTEAEALRASTRDFGRRMRRTMGPRTRA
jgi:predicted CopG family antitoxin